MSWETGQQPWVRAHTPAGFGASTRDGSGAVCYFCGEPTAIISVTDFAEDTGRVDIYCDNTRCDAKEMTIIEIRGGRRQNRADWRALEAVDHPEDGGTTIADVMAQTLARGDVLPRRLGRRATKA